jgi:hypothetical protein
MSLTSPQDQMVEMLTAQEMKKRVTITKARIVLPNLKEGSSKSLTKR